MHNNKAILIPTLALLAGSAAIYSSQTLAHSGDIETNTILVEPDADQSRAMAMARSIFGGLGSATNPAAQAYVADRTEPSQRTRALSALTETEFNPSPPPAKIQPWPAAPTN